MSRKIRQTNNLFKRAINIVHPCSSFYFDFCKKLTPVFTVHSIQLISVLLTRSQEGGGRRRGGGVGRETIKVSLFFFTWPVT